MAWEEDQIARMTAPAMVAFLQGPLKNSAAGNHQKSIIRNHTRSAKNGSIAPMKRLLLLLLSAFPSGSALAAPRIVALVVIDQMRGEYLDRYAADWRGGFKLLRSSGAIFSDA